MRARPRELRRAVLLEHRVERGIEIGERAAHDVVMPLVELHQHRLERALAEVPLEHAEADPLPVEVAGDGAEALRRAAPRLEAAGEREGPVRLRLARERGESRARVREELLPRRQIDDARDREPALLTEAAHR